MDLRSSARTNRRIAMAAAAESARKAAIKRTTMRSIAVCMASVVGLMSFGTLVVRANDDNGALAFFRSQQRAPARAPAPTYRPAPTPTAYFAPRGFFQSAPQRRTADYYRAAPIVASYAPFATFAPQIDRDAAPPTRRVAAGRDVTRTRTEPVVRVALPAPERRVDAPSLLGSRVTYCVRTCDGYFFPLGSSTGSERGDEAACNNLCPTASTRVFYGALGNDIDDARARDNGRRYASTVNAFAYRRSLDKNCSCATSGPGVAHNRSILRDGTLRTGDVVMTPTGMKVFSGGSFPYREANFTAIGRSNLLAGKAREDLRRVEQASLPGRSGISATRSNQPQRRGNELRELAAAQRAAETPTTLVRYVGPDLGNARR
jgi:hypothetical protein